MNNRNVMKSIQAVIVFLALLFISSCYTGNESSDVINNALLLADVNPDSSLCLLHELDSRKLEGKDLAKFSLSYIWALDKSGNDNYNDTLVRNAYRYYSVHGNEQEYGRAMYYVGKYFLMLDSTENAEQCFEKSITFSNKNKDTITEVFATEKLSKIIKYQSLYRADSLAERAVELYSSLKTIDSTNLVWLLLSREKCLSVFDSQKAIEQGCRALNCSYEIGDSSLISISHQYLASTYNYAQEFAEELFHAKQAYNYCENKDFSTVLSLGHAFLECDSIEQCE